MKLSQQSIHLRKIAAILLIFATHATMAGEVVLVRDGVATLPLIAGSEEPPVMELKESLKQISGADFKVLEAASAESGIFVGRKSDFPSLNVDGAEGLGPEGFVLQSDDRSLYLIAETPRGVQHAVTTFLHRLGCRWFFAGDEWTVIPHKKTIAGSWNERQIPSFAIQRAIWPAYGQNPKCRDDWDAWNRHNRMGAAMPIKVNHTGNGLNFRGDDFKQHPEWFAMVDGQRQPTKPCYSHPDVLQKAIQHALARAQDGEQMISMSPPDGLGYCQCPRCMSVLLRTEREEDKSTDFQPGPARSFSADDPIRANERVNMRETQKYQTTFGTRPDGTLVNVTSETLFHFVNQVAEAVAKKHPDVKIGCYAYSAYAHPPTFKLHPNVYIQITTQYRRTPLTIEQQFKAWGERTRLLGVREYYSVYQWDWDGPDPGRVRPDRLQQILKGFHESGVSAINAEASNNWGPRGLGYYVAAQLMWNVDADVAAVIRDFYEQAFGPAAIPMQRYYVRWYGPVAKVMQDPSAPDSPTNEAADDDQPPTATLENLRGAYRGLSDAARLVREEPAYRLRVDHLRMYIHYLVLRHRLRVAAQAEDKEEILQAIAAETVFGGRMEATNMIHVRPLIGKRFLDRFRDHRELLASLPEENHEGKNWRKYGAPPDHTELEHLWKEDGRILGLAD